MKAVVLHEYGGPEKLKFEDNVPEPQISGSTVLIAAAAASVNPIDWKLRSGMRQKDSPLSFPAILGRDVSGIVRAVGANVKHFKAGERGRDPADFAHGRPACTPCGKRAKGTGCSDNGSAGRCWARCGAYGEEDRSAGDCRCSQERAG